jgi:hypothetical protein
MLCLDEGQYNTESGEGKKLMAHELTHVIQQGKQEDNVIDRVAEEREGTTTIPLNSAKWNYHNTTHYANCRGAGLLHGQTRPNYRDSFTHTRRMRRRSTDCTETCRDCIFEIGNLRSIFRANPSVNLPSVPGGLNPCEQRAVRAFINGRLRAHEQDHVRKFSTYTATINTPYEFTGCASDLNRFLEDMHRDKELARRSASDALSASIDPFFASFDCDCPDPAREAVVQTNSVCSTPATKILIFHQWNIFLIPVIQKRIVRNLNPQNNPFSR